MAIEMKRQNLCGNIVRDYSDINVSSKVIGIIQSYTNIVNKMVWRKNKYLI